MSFKENVTVKHNVLIFVFAPSTMCKEKGGR